MSHHLALRRSEHRPPRKSRLHYHRCTALTVLEALGLERVLVALILSLGLLAAPLAAEAQPDSRVYRIGYLSDGNGGSPEFEAGLRDLGYVEGRNLVFEYRSAGGDSVKLATQAVELVGLRVDVIVANGTAAALAARRASMATPIVFLVSADPVGAGLVESLARPGGNVTGPALMSLDIVLKRLELLREVAPRIGRVAILVDPSPSPAMVSAGLVEASAPGLRLNARRFVVRRPAEVEPVFSAMVEDRRDSLMVINSPMLVEHRAQIAMLAAKYRLPAVFEEARFADAGGLMAYGANYPAMFRRAATYVDRILKGAKAADLPVEQPSTFDLVVNMKTAKALGLTIPPSVLLRAGRIIE